MADSHAEAVAKLLRPDPDPSADSQRHEGAIKAGEALRRIMESDPEMQARCERTLEAMLQRLQELTDVIRRARDKLTARHFRWPESIEDLEHLARIAEMPPEMIRTGHMTFREIYEYALAWADRQEIKAKLMAEAIAPADQGEPEPAGESTPTKPKRSTERLAVVYGPAIKCLEKLEAILEDPKLTVGEKLEQMHAVAPIPPCTSKELADMLECNEGTVRRTKFWGHRMEERKND